MLSGLRHAVGRLMWAPAPTRPVVALRVVVGAAALLRVGPAITAATETIGAPPSDSSLALLFGLGNEFALPFNQGAALALVAMFAVAALCFAAGWAPRAAGFTLGGTALYLTHADLAFRFNHLYVLGVVALLVAAAHGPAVGGHRFLRVAAREVTAAWAPNLIRAFISIIYLFAALAKVNEDFLSGATLYHDLGRSVYLNGELPTAVWLWTGLAVSVIASELFLVFGLWWERTRVAAVTVGVTLHVPFILLAGSPVQSLRLLVFTMVMLGTYLLALPAQPRSINLTYDSEVPDDAKFAALVRRYDWFGVFDIAEQTGPLELRTATGRVLSGARARRAGYDTLPATFLLSGFTRHVPARVLEAHSAAKAT